MFTRYDWSVYSNEARDLSMWHTVMLLKLKQIFLFSQEKFINKKPCYAKYVLTIIDILMPATMERNNTHINRDLLIKRLAE